MLKINRFFIALAFVGVSAAAAAQTSGSCGTSLNWALTGTAPNLTLTISGTGAMTDYTVNTAPWFSQAANIKTLVLQSGMTTIGEYSFCYCNAISGTLTLPASISSIGNAAFYDCSGLTGTLTIPNAVTQIGNNAFEGCSGFTGTLTIPNLVAYIGLCPFKNCTGLTTVNFNATNCTAMGSSSEPAFSGCTNLTTLNIGANVTKIPAYAFMYNSTLTGTLTIPNSVDSIGNNAFLSCNGLTGLTIGNSVTSIGNNAFNHCSSLTGTLTIPNSVTTIGDDAFELCSGFTGTLTIPNSITTIGTDAFWSCSGLTEIIIIGNSDTSIESYAFNGCSGLKKVTIGNSITSIGNYAFTGCISLTKVTNLSTTPQSIDVSVFQNVNLSADTLVVPACALTDYQNANAWNTFGTIIGDDSLTYYASGSCGSNLTWTLTGACDITLTISGTGAMTDYDVGTAPWYSQRANITTLVLPSGMTTIGDFAFADCYSLPSTLTIPESVTSIGDAAFYNCSSLTTVNFNAVNCTTMGTVNLDEGTAIPVFYDCPNLTTLNIGKNVTRIPDGAFAFNNLTGNLTIPNSVTYIGTVAFYGCSGLTAITNLSTTPQSINLTVFYGVNLSADTLFVPACALSNYQNAAVWNTFGTIIGDDSLTYASDSCGANLTWTLTGACGNNLTLTISGTGAMTDYSGGNSPWYSQAANIKTLVLENGITKIGNYAFYGCSGFTGTLTIPNSITTIGTNAFWSCSGFTGTLTIPNSITTIGVGAFRNCTGLTELAIPNSVDTIGGYAFLGCSGLTGTLIIPNSVVVIGEVAFQNCSALTGLSLGNSITIIGRNAFYACSGLTGILTIPNSVDTIGGYAFHSCTGLTSVTLGNSVDTITDYAFDNCTGLTRVTNFSMIPQSINANVFNGVDLSADTLYISACALTDYQNAAVWNTFGTILGGTTTPYYTITVKSNDDAMGTAAVTQQPTCTTPQAVIEATANSGYRFTKWNDENTDNPRTITVTSDTTLTAIFEIISGVGDIKDNQLTIYPNPVKDELQVTGYGLGIENVVITDLSGRIVMVVGAGSVVAGSVGAGLKPATTGETTVINVSTLPNGIYFIKVGNNTGKFVKN